MPMSEELLAKVDPGEMITCRPADLLEPELSKLEEEVGDYREQEEDVLTYALFGQVAMDYFRRRAALRNKVDPDAIDMKNKSYPA
jgi:oxaloacetate decarboxylase alpha subunit